MHKRCHFHFQTRSTAKVALQIPATFFLLFVGIITTRLLSAFGACSFVSCSFYVLFRKVHFHHHVRYLCYKCALTACCELILCAAESLVYEYDDTLAMDATHLGLWLRGWYITAGNIHQKPPTETRLDIATYCFITPL